MEERRLERSFENQAAVRADAVTGVQGLQCSQSCARECLHQAFYLIGIKR